MNLKQWIEDKIRENSWEQRLNEDSPYEDNAILLAKPILKRLKNGKIAVDKARSSKINQALKAEGKRSGNRDFYDLANREYPVNNEFIIENGKPDFLGEEPLDWLLENYPEDAKNILFGSDLYDPYRKVEGKLNTDPSNYVHIEPDWLNSKDEFIREWEPGATSTYNVNFISRPINGESQKGVWTMEELIDEVTKQQQAADLLAKQQREAGMLKRLEEDFE